MGATKHSHALSRIRQICSLGLPSRSFMPLVIAALRAVIPASCAQFTWASASGRLVNFWSDTLRPRRAAWIILNHRRYEADAGIGFRDLVMFGAASGNMRALWQRGFESSATYAAVFKPYDLHWFLDGVVRDAMRPYGCFALLRSREAGDFSADEQALLERAADYVAHAMRVEAAAPQRFVRSSRSALVVCDARGEVLEWSTPAQELALLACVEAIDLDARVDDSGGFAEVRQALHAITCEIAALLDDEAGPLPVLVRRNGWGEFALRGYRLHSDARAGGAPARIGVLIEQHLPFEAHLLERVNATDLSMRQREVALLSAKGLTQAQIGQRLNLTPQTVKDYFKGIYARLQIGSRDELLQRLGALA